MRPFDQESENVLRKLSIKYSKFKIAPTSEDYAVNAPWPLELLSAS